MNSLSLWIYFASIFDSINKTGIVFLVISAILIVIVLLVVLNNTEESELLNNCIKTIKISAYVFVISLFTVIFVPTKETTMMIVASQFSEKILTNQAVLNLADPSIDLLKTWIEEETKKLKVKN